jgi:hypothetical protein
MAISVLLLACATSPLARAQTIFAVTGNAGHLDSNGTVGATLYTVNPGTGVATLVGDVKDGATQLNNMNALSFNPLTGQLYGMTSPTDTVPGGALYSIDKNTGAATLIGSNALSIVSMAFSPAGTLYAIDDPGANLSTVNLTTGAIATVGPLQNASPSDGGLAFGISGTMYLKSYIDLFTVDPATGAASATFIHRYGDGLGNAVAISPTTGIAYGIQLNAFTSDLYSVDLSSNNDSLIATIYDGAGNPVSYVSALAFAPIPEPNLILTGLFCLGMSRIRRRRIAS